MHRRFGGRRRSGGGYRCRCRHRRFRCLGWHGSRGGRHRWYGSGSRCRHRNPDAGNQIAGRKLIAELGDDFDDFTGNRRRHFHGGFIRLEGQQALVLFHGLADFHQQLDDRHAGIAAEVGDTRFDHFRHNSPKWNTQAIVARTGALANGCGGQKNPAEAGWRGNTGNPVFAKVYLTLRKSIGLSLGNRTSRALSRTSMH